MSRAPADSSDRRQRGDRRAMPAWRQVLEGIGLVIAISAVVTGVGFVLALVVAWAF